MAAFKKSRQPEQRLWVVPHLSFMLRMLHSLSVGGITAPAPDTQIDCPAYGLPGADTSVPGSSLYEAVCLNRKVNLERAA